MKGKIMKFEVDTSNIEYGFYLMIDEKGKRHSMQATDTFDMVLHELGITVNSTKGSASGPESDIKRKKLTV